MHLNTEPPNFWDDKVVSYLSACTKLLGDKCMHHYPKPRQNGKYEESLCDFVNVILILCLWYLLGLPSDSLVYEKPWIKNATFQLRAGAPKKLIGVALVG